MNFKIVIISVLKIEEMTHNDERENFNQVFRI